MNATVAVATSSPNGTPAALPRPAPALSRRRESRRWLKTIAYVASFAALLWFFIDGHSYYTKALAERPHHPDYRALRPAGSRGLAFGIVGASLMIMMLGYTMRKRLKIMSRWGALSWWLDFHIFCGVIGPCFIVLHTAFKVDGLVAVAFWAMVSVAVSGVLGRYLYQQIPRTMQGDQMSFDEAGQLKDQLLDDLRGQFGLTEAALSGLVRSAEKTQSIGLWRTLWTSVWADCGSLFARPGALPAGQDKGRSHREIAHLNQTLRRMTLLDRRIRGWHRMQRLFHYWHVFHKPFAIIMYAVMGIHIVVAIWTGYGWMR